MSKRKQKFKYEVFEMLNIKRNSLKVLALSLGMTVFLGMSNGVGAATHQVEKGETLYRIATQYNMTVSELKSMNNLKGNTIYAGQKLTVKEVAATHVVKKGETLYSIAKKYEIKVEDLKTINKLKTNKIYVGQKLKVTQPAADPAKEAFAKQVTLQVQNGYKFVKEEPGKFQLFSTRDSHFFVRVEVLDKKVKHEDLKIHAQEYLKGTGKVTEVKDLKHVHPFYKDAQMYYLASNAQLSQSIVVKKVNGEMLRFTLHFPNKEEAEDITPTLLKQLQTIKVK